MNKFLTRVVSSILVMACVFGLVDALNPARAETTTSSVQTFTTSYKAYNDRTSWRKNMTLAERCTDTERIYGARPTAPGNYPVLLYIHGTFADMSNNKEGREIVKLAASKGYVAMALTYDSNETMNAEGIKRQAYCMFDQNHAKDGVTSVCSVAGVDCSKGLLVAGFSQGGAIATLANNYNPNIKGVWAMGLSAYIFPKYVLPTDLLPAPYGTRVLPNNKLVINMGQASTLSNKDLLTQDLPSLKQLTGVDCGLAIQCLQPDGSGFYVVRNGEVADGTADHAYWMQVNKYNKNALSFTLSPSEDTFDPDFLASSDTPWSFARNLDWLKSQLNQ